MRFATAFLSISIVLAGAESTSASPQKITGKEEVTVGKSLPVAAATVLCGPLESKGKYSFDAASFGKVRGYSPTTDGGRKIVVYTRALDDGFFRLAGKIDALIAKDARYGESIVIVLDEKGAQRGGYSVEEIHARRSAVGKLAEKNAVKNLTFFVSAPPAESFAPQLGLKSDNLLLVHLGDAGKNESHALVKSFVRVDTKKLDAEAVSATMEKLKREIDEK